MIENKVAKVCMSIEAVKIGLTEIHQDLVCAFKIAAVLPVVGFYDEVGKRILCARSRQHLLHLKFWTRSPRDDWFGPGFDRLSFFASVVLGWIPHTPLAQFERGKAQRLRVEPRRFNFTER